MTSFMFMLVDVPEPVWNTSIGKWSSHWPRATSAAESWIARATSSGSTPSSWLTTLDAPLIDASAPISARSIRSPDTGKFSTARCVWAPHRAVLRHPHLPHRVVLEAELVSGHDPNLRCCFDDRPRLHRAPPPRPGRHAVPAAHHRRRVPVEAAGRTFLQVEPEVLTLLTRTAFRDIAHWLRPAHLAQLRRILDDPEASRQRPLRRPRPAQERQHRGRRRAADVPGHRHRDRDGQARRARAHGRRRRASDQPRHPARPTRRPRCASRRWRPLTMWEEQNTGTNLPAQIELYAAAGRRLQAPLHGQGRRLGQQELPVPGDQGGAEPLVDAPVPRREAPHARHRRPARRTTSPSSSAARRPSSR